MNLWPHAITCIIDMYTNIGHFVLKAHSIFIWFDHFVLGEYCCNAMLSQSIAVQSRTEWSRAKQSKQIGNVNLLLGIVANIRFANIHVIGKLICYQWNYTKNNIVTAYITCVQTANWMSGGVNKWATQFVHLIMSEVTLTQYCSTVPIDFVWSDHKWLI